MSRARYVVGGLVLLVPMRRLPAAALIAMMYLPIVLVTAMLVCGSLGLVFPYHAPPPSNPDPPMP